MKNSSEYALEALPKSSKMSMKNKARLSEMTAFSFDHQPENMKINQRCPFKRFTVTVFFLRFSCPNETSKSSLTQTISTLFIAMKWWPSPEGGIVLLRLLVSV